MRIAMWSGPRNLSTAMMYAFGARPDCAVWDEPFYAAYLVKTGLVHPMRDEIIAAGERCSDQVIAGCLGPIPVEKPHFYQKHMTQHMVAGFDRGWVSEMQNIFLIRHPARVIASYAAKREGPCLADIGFLQQLELIEMLEAQGKPVVVIDSFDVRKNPRAVLETLCSAIALPFEPAMLSWPAGGHKEDGVWASHWYGAVHQSTGFGAREGGLPVLDDAYKRLLAQALPIYRDMEARKL